MQMIGSSFGHLFEQIYDISEMRINVLTIIRFSVIILTVTLYSISCVLSIENFINKEVRKNKCVRSAGIISVFPRVRPLSESHPSLGDIFSDAQDAGRKYMSMTDTL